MTTFGEAPPQRQRLAKTLRSLRLEAGLTTTQLAERVGMSQSKVSRVELGQSAPQVADVDAWARAVGADAAARARLLALAEAVATEATVWRQAVRAGLPRLQLDVRDLEASAATISNYQPVLVPGLLQTPEYARRVVAANFPGGRDDLAAAIGARMERQAVLYDDNKRLTFVLAEAALRWRFGPRAVLLEQLDRIASVAALPSVTVAIIPQAATVEVWHSHGFNLFDDRGDEPPLAHIETLTAGLTVTDPDDVEEYRAAFGRLRAAAVTGESGRAVLRGVTADLQAD